MLFFQTDGLLNTDYKAKSVPMFLTDEYEVLEAPTYWALDVLTRKSGSEKTLNQYTGTLARYLQWRDDYGHKAKNWQFTDEDIVKTYVAYLKSTKKNGKPSNKTIESYIARIQDFYKWALKNGYRHYWNLDMKIVQVALKDQSMLNQAIEVGAKEVKLQHGETTAVNKELEKFVFEEDFTKILSLFEDDVYRFMAVTIWMTALRPMEVLQLPYLGTGENRGLRRYRENELENLQNIYFRFKSKGKYRSIMVPVALWKVICRNWMPLRQERAEIYRQKHGVSPPNSALFLSKEGRPVSYSMLYNNFSNICFDLGYPAKLDSYLKAMSPDQEAGNLKLKPRRTLCPKMLRHSFATYFVLRALQQNDMLNKPYVYNAAVDNELKEWMGHTDIGTTYKNYVHLISRYFRGDLIYDFRKGDFQKALSLLESKADQNKNKLYVLVGIPGAGKTTYAEKYLRKVDTLIVSTDEIRKKLTGVYNFSPEINENVFNDAKRDVKEALSKGLNVVFDATNISKEHRKGFLEIARHTNSDAIALVFTTPLSVCLERNSKRNPERRVPEEAIEKMSRYDAIISLDEGFSEVHYINESED